MAVRQYVGARYVPRFSEVNGGVWSNVYAYEPLTIVKNGNDYYTSKQSVPVGVAITNTDYWVKTGDYNGAISSLQDQIDDINSEIEHIADRKYIFIGDSYGDRPVNWIDNVVSMMNLAFGDYYKSAVGGAGFAFGTTFQSQLTTLASSIADKDSITDIIVGGGFNDRAQNQANVATAIGNFVTYAKLTFKNARVHIGFIGWSFNSEFVSELIANDVLNTYKQCAKYGAAYIDHSDEVMHDSRLFDQEPQAPYTLYLGYQYVHPSSAGSQAIANCIANYLISNDGVSYDGQIEVVPTFSGGASLGVGDPTLIMRKNGNNVVVGRKFYTLLTVNFSSPVNMNGATIEIGTLESGFIAGVSTATLGVKCLTFMPVLGFAVIGGKNVTFNGFLMFANNRIYLHSYIEGATSVSTIGLWGGAAVFNTNDI